MDATASKALRLIDYIPILLQLTDSEWFTLKT